MKKSIIALASAMAFICAGVSAQDLKTGYFLDNYLYGYRLNPALQTEVTDNFVGVIFGDSALGINSDLGLSNILFPTDNGLVTGFNSAVSASEFLSGLKNSNKMSIDINENIFALGHRAKDGKGFWTLELNAKSTSGLSAPMSMFEFLKAGSSNSTYTIRNLNLTSKNYFELALGYSRKINDRLSVGGAVKGLIGCGYLNMEVSSISIDTRKSPQVATGVGSVTGAFPLIDVPVDSEGYMDFGNIKKGKNGLSGFGAAVDFGVDYEVIDGLHVSAAVLDLGAIAWKKSLYGELGEYSFYILENEDIDDNLNDMLHFKNEKASGCTFDMLCPQVNFGARYVLPFAQKVSLDALYSFRFGSSIYKYIDFRAGATYTPSKVLSIAANVGVNNYGTCVGAALNLNAGPVNFFAGIDGIFVNVTPQFVPINPLNTVAKAGLSFMIGRKK